MENTSYVGTTATFLHAEMVGQLCPQQICVFFAAVITTCHSAVNSYSCHAAVIYLIVEHELSLVEIVDVFVGEAGQEEAVFEDAPLARLVQKASSSISQAFLENGDKALRISIRHLDSKHLEYQLDI